MKRISLLFILILCANLSAQEDKTTNALIQASAIGVTIGGNFIVTGTFPAFINERVDQFVTRLFNEAKETALSSVLETRIQREIEKQSMKYSLRNIKLKRANGEERVLDLLKFRRTGDFEQNPYLKHDDILIFPYTDIESNFFTVSGAVMEPGKFHYVEGDKLSDAIELAGGINKAYENIKIKIYRTSYSGDKVDILTPGKGEDINLMMGDRVFLEATETGKKEYNVLILGEVNNPGSIPITKNNTTLKEVIDRAGGLKSTASLKNSKLYTGNIASIILEKIYGIEIKNIGYYSTEDARLTEELVNIEKILMYRLSSLTEEDTAYFFLENQLRVITEGSAVDFSKIEKDPSEMSAYIAKDGDIIIIPQKQSTIYLFGSVAMPGHLPFEEGKDVYYYINKAGGLGEYAEEDEIMIIKGNSRKWIPLDGEYNIEEGDYIYIPRDTPHSFNYYVGIVSQYLGILGSAATVILLLVQFGK